jgi:putative transposase
MQIPSSMPRLKGFRFPREIVSYAVWACHRFALSTADGEEDPDLIRGIKSPTNGDTPDILVQTRRNAKAAKRFLTRLIALSGQPRVVITDKRRSYTKPIARLAPGADHPAHEGLNNRIEGSHRPTRRREKIMGRFNSPRQARRFLATHDQINTIFKPRRHHLTVTSHRHARADAFGLWADYALAMTP